MGNDEEIRGKFGYEGEGFDEGADTEPHRSIEIAADRGWNIGRKDNEDDERPPAGRQGRQP